LEEEEEEEEEEEKTTSSATRTGDLPACSIVSQSNTLPRVPYLIT
jgi:hypothetical protein